MRSVGIEHDDLITYFEEDLSKEDIETGSYYIFKLSGDFKYIVRTVTLTKSGDMTISPMTTNPNYRVREVMWEDFTKIYRVSAVTKLFLKGRR